MRTTRVPGATLAERADEHEASPPERAKRGSGVSGDEAAPEVGAAEEQSTTADAASASPPAEGTDAQLDPAQLAALRAAKAAKKARKAQRQAEKARRLADEYARLAAEQQVSADPLEPTAAEPASVELSKGLDDDGAAPGPEAAAASGGSRAPLVTAVVAVVAGLILAVVGTAVFLNRGTGDSRAKVRDTVLRVAQQDIVVLNTMDYRDVDAGLQRWADASTGDLHQQLVSGRAKAKRYLENAQDVTTAQVKDAAITTLDANDGTASVIASVYLTVTPKSGKPQVNRERLLAELTRVGSQWKLSSLGQVPVGS